MDKRHEYHGRLTARASDLRREVSTRVTETGWPDLGHGSPFIRTQNRGGPNGKRVSNTLRLLWRE
jgi:hypothetical protein